MPETKAILWDFDGTLSYPNRCFSSALYMAVSQFGYTIEKHKTTEFLSTAYSWKNPDAIYIDRTWKVWWDTMFGKITAFCIENGIKVADIPEINARFREVLINAENYCLYDDAIETLKKCLELGYKNILATNNYPEITENLEKLGVAPYLTDCVVSSHIGYEKPRKEFYDEAKRRGGNSDIVYMIGDNPIADIRGGNDAGLITIAVHECKNSEADFYVENLTDILAILK